ncbi:aldehyde dehydrogenase (NADP(+)) [Acinetobacter stercoris]|uniref:Alpha-ketoglutaric semialdehyde dehydrogenase n=1 Tax=Acinetobacter stercoris TaxID=2126983 RepID=A0A2U3N385_9GAMM|nr:aldehyde dehydrogenase (NADP(+)) [Acinetobacter stercoris]SPL72141.1 Alpha-ketoglutaric semialdehyde dehydrogenase [Acinetobacter stercoris]
MNLSGEMLIGQNNVKGINQAIYAINPANNQTLDPAYLGGTQEHVNQACTLAWQAFDIYRNKSVEERAIFLETIAENIENIGDLLIQRAMDESGLTRARLEGERGRTCGQLRLFAKTIRAGEWLDIRVDEALPNRQPVPRFDLRQQHIALGPVAVFGASNFPLAFSVAGGDTASALAAGCPVVVKAHSAHPGTSELVGKAIQQAVKQCNLPEGVFSLLYGAGNIIGSTLVEHPYIKAVGFTGSRNGGTALMKIAQNRSEPIPVYAEMSSINPVVLLPSMLENNPDTLGQAFVHSLTQGAGQFCTNPGLVIAIKSPALDIFKKSATEAVQQSMSQTMLTPGIFQAFLKSVNTIEQQNKVSLLAKGLVSPDQNQCQTHLFSVDAIDFLNNELLQSEMFGSASIIIECKNMDEAKLVIEQLEGQLTATLHMDQNDMEDAQRLLAVLERKVGRILINSWPTGVEVCDAMVHGGPYPSTSDARTTSVGTAAIFRFLRPVCYQNFPDDLLPDAIKQSNPLKLSRLINGERE